MARIVTVAITAVGVFLIFLTPLHASFFHTSVVAWTLAYAADITMVTYMFVLDHIANLFVFGYFLVTQFSRFYL